MLRRSRLLAATLVLALAGCTSAKPIMTPDGRMGYTVDCSERLLTWEDCFERADDWTSMFCGEQSALVAAEPQRLHDSPTTRRSMVIACKR